MHTKALRSSVRFFAHKVFVIFYNMQFCVVIGGLETEKEYPYEGRGETCQFKKSDAVAFVNNSVTLPSDEAKMATWLSQNGPISIGINAFTMQVSFVLSKLS